MNIMSPRSRTSYPLTATFLFLFLLSLAPARADVVCDWNTLSADIAAAAKLPPPAAYRVMALVQTAVLEATVATASGDPHGETTRGALDAAVAAAHRTTLLRVVPSQEATIVRAYERALAAIPDGPGKLSGLAAGERAALAVLERRAADDPTGREGYRPATPPGVYVPTTLPVASDWSTRVPWRLSSPGQFRPPPPPALDGQVWERDLQETQRLGARSGSARTDEQTAIARFWEATMPSIYFSIVRSLADVPGRGPVANARLFATAAQAMDDALIATFEAKYHFGLWRPLTAIRNADRDGCPATQRDGSWLPLIDTPMHPEYPAAHSSLAGALAAVLRAEFGTSDLPLSAVSPTAPGVVRTWSSLDALVAEVSEARICAGVHYRNSTEVGTGIGRKVGEWAVARSEVARQ